MSCHRAFVRNHHARLISLSVPSTSSIRGLSFDVVNVKMLPESDAMTSMTSVPVRTDSSCAFFIMPAFRLLKEVWRLFLSSMYEIFKCRVPDPESLPRRPYVSARRRGGGERDAFDVSLAFKPRACACRCWEAGRRGGTHPGRCSRPRPPPWRVLLAAPAPFL